MKHIRFTTSVHAASAVKRKNRQRGPGDSQYKLAELQPSQAKVFKVAESHNTKMLERLRSAAANAQRGSHKKFSVGLNANNQPTVWRIK